MTQTKIEKSIYGSDRRLYAVLEINRHLTDEEFKKLSARMKSLERVAKEILKKK